MRKNFVTYGADLVGFEKAIAHEKVIVDSSLVGEISTNEKTKVDDLVMGVAAPANIRHWAKYAALLHE